MSKKIMTFLGLFIFMCSFSQSFLVGFSNFTTAPTTNPRSIIVCNGNSLLKVKLSAVISSTSGATVTISLPTGIQYVSGSVTKLTSNAGLTITENGGTPQAPQFLIGPANISVGNDIEFTIARSAICTARAAAIGGTTFKDHVTATIAGNATDADSGSYTVTYPVISITQPATQTNTVVGTSYTRTFSIANGGNGNASSVYLSLNNTGITTNTLTLTGGSGSTGAPVVLTPTSVSGTTSYYTIPAANLSGGNLDNGETLTFSENYKVTACNGSTNYSVGWGCSSAPANWCDTKTGTGATSTASGVPDVKYLAGSAVRVQGSNLCNNAITTTIIKNQGNEAVAGAGTAFNLIQLLGYDGGEVINVRDPLEIQNVQISNGAGGWINLTQTGGGAGTSTTAARIDFSQLTSDPDGAGGLTDADGDGKFDDLPVNAQIQLRYEVVMPAQNACASQSKSGNPSYQSTYNNQCGGATITGSRANATIMTAVDRNATSNIVSPSDISTGQTATIRLNGYRDFGANSANFAYVCPTGTMTMKIVTPKGFTLTGGRYYKNGVGVNGSSTDTSGTLSFTTIPGTTTDTQVITGLNNDATGYYSFEADLVLNCATYNGGAITYTVEYSCDATATCGPEILACGTVPMTAHCSPPCAGGGLTSTSSQFIRTSVGYATPTSTATYANPANLTATQLATVLPYDAVKGVFNGTLYPNLTGVTLTNHYFSLEYPQISAQNILAPNGGGVFTVTNAITGATQTCTIAAPLSNTVTSGVHKMVYDLSACGLVINANDTVHFEPIFTVVNNTGFAQTPTQVSGLVTKFYSTATTNPGVEYTCDTFSGQLTPHIYALSRNDGTGSIVNTGCSTYNYVVGFHVASIIYDIYPKEIRPAFILNKIVVESLSNDNFTGTANLVAWGTTTDGYATNSGTTFSIIPYVAYSNNNKTATYTNDGTWPMGDLAAGNGNNIYNLTVGLINGCESLATGSVQVTYYFTSNGYAYNNPAVQVPKTSVVSRGIQNTLSTVTLSNQSGTVQASKPTETAVVRLSNLGTVSTPYTWLAFPTDSNYTITQVLDVATNTPVTLVPYSGGVWAKLSTTGLTSGQTKDYRISFTYTVCTNYQITVNSGWNCSGYPTDPSTAPCVSTVTLPFSTIAGQVQLISVTQPTSPLSGLCQPLNYEYRINSSGGGNLNSVKFAINQVTGSTVTPSTIQAEYPAGAGNWAAVSYTTSGNQILVDLTTHPAYPANGIPGTLNDGGVAANRQIGIRFSAVTGCTFVSGSSFSVASYAKNSCGSDALGNGSVSSTNSITVTGADPAYLISSDFQNLSSTTFNNCNSPVNIILKQTVISAATTGSTGTVRIDLPIGYDFQNPTAVSCSTTFCPTVQGVYTDATNNNKYMVLNVPSGMASGDAMQYTVPIIKTAPVACTTVNTIQVRGFDKAGNISCPSSPSGTCPNVVIQTGQTSFDFTVSSPILNISNISGSFSGGALTGSITIQNTSSISQTNSTPSNPVKVDFYCADNNGNPTTLLGTVTLGGPFNAGSTVTEVYSLTTAPCASANKIYAVISTNKNCICSDASGVFSLFCYKPAQLTGTVLDTNHGITALGRAGVNGDNWPMIRKGAWTVLESKSKGFVINRLTDTQMSAIPATDLVEGMMIYNITQQCLMINTDGTVSGWKCYITPACPD